ncbi:hypothetical protein Acaty_c1832 [Acidithiobacillus caldus ATCC 51756]|uniref:Uncharacterized protein n=1 Tax=Acidithiobacillus caldus (strain ATCC 51756 / DSM 8584 / KU) TaxID=637389 RepID=A0A060A0C4_ACICK|nr:hypothetical protein Acaty_c1832 [Acidithiobacillus caldus ATCC 51756]
MLDSGHAWIPARRVSTRWHCLSLARYRRHFTRDPIGGGRSCGRQSCGRRVAPRRVIAARRARRGAALGRKGGRRGSHHPRAARGADQ